MTRQFTRTRLFSVLAVALIGSPLVIGAVAPASANPPPPVVVDADGHASATNCNDATTALTTIQAGVNAAAAGGTVKVCPGSYAEDVTIAKALTIKGPQAGVDARNARCAARPPSPTNEAIVSPADGTTGTFHVSASGVTIDGFEVVNNTNGPGIQLTNTQSGFAILNNVVSGNVFGIYANSTNASPALSNIQSNCIHDNNATGAANGNGIYTDQGIGNVTVQANRIDDNLNAAVTVTQAPPTTGTFFNTTVRILNNTVKNTLANNNSWIIIFSSDNVVVSGNNLRNVTADPTCSACGSGIFIGAPTRNITVSGNTLSNANYNGIAVRDRDGFGNPQSGQAQKILLSSNSIVGSGNSGIDVGAAAPGAVSTFSNSVKHNGLAACNPTIDPGCGRDGILYESVTQANLIKDNTALKNLGFDCHDTSVGTKSVGTANSWVSNTGKKSSPAGLCTKP